MREPLIGLVHHPSVVHGLANHHPVAVTVPFHVFGGYHDGIDRRSDAAQVQVDVTHEIQGVDSGPDHEQIDIAIGGHSPPSR